MSLADFRKTENKGFQHVPAHVCCTPLFSPPPRGVRSGKVMSGLGKKPYSKKSFKKTLWSGCMPKIGTVSRPVTDRPWKVHECTVERAREAVIQHQSIQFRERFMVLIAMKFVIECSSGWRSMLQLPRVEMRQKDGYYNSRCPSSKSLSSRSLLSNQFHRSGQTRWFMLPSSYMWHGTVQSWASPNCSSWRCSQGR